MLQYVVNAQTGYADLHARSPNLAVIWGRCVGGHTRQRYDVVTMISCWQCDLVRYEPFSLRNRSWSCPLSITLEDIPALMDGMQWTVAARLMRRWFAGSAWGMTSADKEYQGPFATYDRSRLDDQIVTMTWASRFRRISDALSKLDSEWRWQSDSLALLQSRVDRMRSGMPAPPWRFGDLRAGATVVEDTCQIRRGVAGGLMDPLDDCYGALGVTNVKLAVSGIVKREGQRLFIDVDQVGHYLKDTYDFLGDQFLGLWDRDGISNDRIASGLTRFGLANQVPIPIARADTNQSGQQQDMAYQVSNQSFRGWRDANGKGRDFFIFSDVAIIDLATPVRILLDV